MANKIQEWNFQKKFVDDDIFKNNENYISAESVVIAAGPPFIDSNTNFWNNLYAIGVVQGFDMAQSRQIQQLFEIGSKQSYFIPSKTFVNVGLSRVLVNGPNLLKAIYKLEGAERPEETSLGDNLPGNPYNPDGYNPESEDSSVDSAFYINLSSAFFNKPIGLLLMIQDSEGDNYAACYLENCMVASHQMTMQAQQSVLLENVSIRAMRVVPLDIASGT